MADLHNLLGALTAVAVIVVSVTGILLKHIDLLGLAGPPAGAAASSTGGLLPVGDVVERAVRHVAGDGGSIDLDRAVWRLGEGTVEVLLETNPPTTVTVDAATGKVLGKADRHDLEVTRSHSGEF